MADAIVPLNYTPPTSADISAKWKEFLQRAASDPDIINYYNALITKAGGDLATAKDFLQKDYEMGVRFTTDTLTATLKSLGLTSTDESNTLADTLNKRGIATTQGPQNTTPYAGGGQAATEVGTLKQKQGLRQEAEQRSASQNIEKAGLTKTEGEQQAQSAYQDKQLAYQKAKEGDITNRASQYMGIESQKQNADLLNAQLKQQNTQQGGGGGQFGGYNSKDEWFHAKTGGNQAPVGWNG